MKAEPEKNGGRGALVISLDFELHWGVRDSKPLDSYRENLLGVRAAVPGMLRLFQQYGVHATWAAVGFIFFEKKNDLLGSLPACKPAYRNRRFSPYEELDGLGANESEDPLHFATSLIRQVSAAPNQEIGSHTFSHYYCLEEGQDVATFRADLEAAQRAATRYGLKLRSLVFPRNQYTEEYVAASGEMGFAAYRGTESSWLYQSRAHGDESLLRRALRLADAYVGLTPHHCHSLNQIRQARPLNIPASRFLRPYSPALAGLEPLRLRRVLSGLQHAAENGLVYHLWWHPHNFGVNTAENLAFLEKVLKRFAELREARGMESLNMGEIAQRLGAAGAGNTMNPGGVVLLAGPDVAGSVTYNFLSRELEVAQVIREHPVSKLELVRGRLRRYGPIAVLGQVLFRLLAVPCLELASRSRIREIMREGGLDEAPPPSGKVSEVQSVNSEAAMALLRQLQPKVVVIAGTRILSQQVLDCVPARFVNLHAGITPLYRGVHGAYWALAEGKEEACGVTVHLVDAGIDTGGILEQAIISPTPRDNFATYPWLQLAAGLPLLLAAARNVCDDRIDLQPLPAGPSKLWSHPTLAGYLWRRLRDGVQ